MSHTMFKRRLTFLILVLLLAAAAACSPKPAFDGQELVAGLRDNGLDAEVVPFPYSPGGYMVNANAVWLLCLNGQEATLYEYATASDREADQATIRPSGNPADTAIDLYWGRLMWWARGQLIVNYNFDQAGVSESLSDVLGPTISPDGNRFGEPPSPLPTSPFCPAEGEVTESAAASQRAAWGATEPGDYRIRYEVRNHNGIGGSPGDGIYEVVVRNGSVVECAITDGYQQRDGPCPFPDAATVEGLFARLAGFDPAFTSAQFDQTWHFPMVIEFDDPNTADEEYSITVRLFEQLVADR